MKLSLNNVVIGSVIVFLVSLITGYLFIGFEQKSNANLNIKLINSAPCDDLWSKIYMVECYYLKNVKRIPLLSVVKGKKTMLIINDKNEIKEMLYAIQRSSALKDAPITDGMFIFFYFNNRKIAKYYCKIGQGHIISITPILYSDTAYSAANLLDDFFQKKFQKELMQAAQSED